MKKLFLIFSAVILTMSMSAATYTLEPGENKIETAIASLTDGDVLELQTGNYTEWHSLTFTTKVTIQAAEGAKPKLALCNWKIQNDFEINGVEITNVSKDNYLFRVYENVAGTVAFKNCSMQLHEEVTDPQAYIIVKEGKCLGNLVIDNCLFKDNATSQGAVVRAYGSSTNVTNFTMSNSTAYNCGTELTVWFEGLANANVDHCTFYNCGTRELYLKAATMNNYSVQNCVIANATAPTESNYCIASYAGTVDNCVYYNTSAPRSGSVNTNCINADPQFVDPANGNFNFSVFSPLCFAATDGSHIGDPRWISVAGEGINLPATLNKENVGAVSSDMTYYGTSNEYFDFGPNDSSNDTLRWAKWLVNVKKCAYSVSVDLTSTNNYKLVFDVIDPSTGAVVLTSDTAKTTSFKTIDFSELEEKAYILRLKNRQGWSKVKVKSLTFAYLGGAVVDIPGTLPVADAILSSGAQINTGGYITYASATKDNARWNINATKAGLMSVKMDVVATNGNGHTYMVALYSMEGDSITAVKEKEWTDASGIMNLVGTIAIPQAGNYYVVVRNTLSGSTATFKDVVFSYQGGAVVDLPATLLPEDAMLSEKAFIENDTIFFAPRGAEGFTPDGWAKWNVNVTEKAKYLFKANCFKDNDMSIKIAVIDAENDTIYNKTKKLSDSGDIEADLGMVILEAGAYVIQMRDTIEFSDGRLLSVVVTKEDLPVEITISENATDNALLTENLDKTINVTLERSMPTGMFSTICLPFGASKSGQFEGAKIYYLDSTALHGDEVILYFKENPDFYQGVPYIVEPATEVNNPTFENVTIKKTEGGSTSKTHATFRGTFIKTHLTAGNENLLYLGAENTLYFPPVGDESKMKGLRGYFEILQDANAPIRRASIHMGTNVVTTLDLVDGKAIPNGLFMLNGQIEIRVNGQKYMLNGMQK